MKLYYGFIFSGKGIPQKRIKENYDLYFRKTGMRFYEGTLNIQLENGPIENSKSIFIDENEITTDGNKTSIYLIPAKFKKDDVFILYPSNPFYDRSIIELLASVNLRKKYQMNDNDYVEVSIE
jgi:CTP-dependent riboflavin kinase